MTQAPVKIYLFKFYKIITSLPHPVLVIYIMLLVIN